MVENPAYKDTIKLCKDMPPHPPIHIQFPVFPKIILLELVDTAILIQMFFERFREICGFVFITFNSSVALAPKGFHRLTIKSQEH